MNSATSRSHLNNHAKMDARAHRHDLAVRIPVFVAQVSNLLYRGFPIRRRTYDLKIAGWKPAIQQVGNLRYDLRAPKYC